VIFQYFGLERHDLEFSTWDWVSCRITGCLEASRQKSCLEQEHCQCQIRLGVALSQILETSKDKEHLLNVSPGILLQHSMTLEKDSPKFNFLINLSSSFFFCFNG